MLREVAGTGGGDPPGSAPAPLSSFLRRRPAEPVPWRGRRAATAAAPPGVACGARPRPKGEQALGARGGGQMRGRGDGGGGIPGMIGSGTRIWNLVLGGGGLEAAAATAATAKPPRGAGGRAHVCAGKRGAGSALGRAAGARSLSSGPRDRHAENVST